MKIIINNQTFEYENRQSNIDKVFDKINSVLEKNNMELSHLLVDGKPVYNDFYDFISANIETIDSVEVIVQDIETLIKETLISACNYITSAILSLSQLAESFYKNPSQQIWSDFADFLEGVEWLINTVNGIDRIKNLGLFIKKYEVWNHYVHTMRELEGYVPELAEAMNNQDQVLIGDLLLYELLPVLEKAQKNLCELAVSGGKAHVS